MQQLLAAAEEFDHPTNLRYVANLGGSPSMLIRRSGSQIVGEPQVGRLPGEVDLARAADFRIGSLKVRPSILQVDFEGASRTLEPRVMQVLVLLANERGEVVSRDQLIDCCWSGRVVGDDAINRCIAKIRRLGEESGDFEVETITRVGYRLLETAGEAATAAVRASRPRSLPVLAMVALVLAIVGGGIWYWRTSGQAPQPTVAVQPLTVFRRPTRCIYNGFVPEASTREPATSSEATSGPRQWTLRQRIVLALIVWAGYWFIRLLGPTLRVSVSYEPGAQKTLAERPLVASFWHSCIIPATYIFRDMGIRVMSSYSYDGEYMGRIIKRFGFVAVKGSSSRNPIRALLGLRRALDEGWTVAFTLDGPRGPRHQVKPGPVGLGRSSGLPLTSFHAAVEQAWVLNSWDRMMIPRPFSRVLVRVGRLIPVPQDASEAELERCTAELQATLDRVCQFAEANVGKVGTSDFPVGDER